MPRINTYTCVQKVSNNLMLGKRPFEREKVMRFFAYLPRKTLQ